ncbi:MAG: hypothetical protein ACQEWF_05635 [Bacillota bacterium]
MSEMVHFNGCNQIIGFVSAIVFQIFQKYAKLMSFFNVKFFLVLTIDCSFGGQYRNWRLEWFKD